MFATGVRAVLAIIFMAALAACGGAPLERASSANPALSLLPGEAAPGEVAALSQKIMGLGANVDPAEAARAARIAYSYTAQLRRDYQITDGPLVHNIKVNNGTKPRGLCWHWAQDMETRLGQENFQTLDLHRAIANFDNWRLEHSTVIISAAGADMYDGLVLDPWRKGGVLVWEDVRADTRYNWTPRQEVFAYKRARGELTTRYVDAAGATIRTE